MVIRLKNRQKYIPNGFKFYLPEVKWRAPSNASFERIVRELMSVVAANPAQAQRGKWPSSYEEVADWVDRYNAEICYRMGWSDYIIDSSAESLPKLSPQHQQESLLSLSAAAARAKELVAGAKTITEWIDSGEPPVPSQQSLQRAIVCAACPLNEKGDLTKWFVVPAAELIKRQVQRMHERKLTTPRDDELNICTACHCPLKLKVHIPIGWVTKKLTDEQKEKLKSGRDCWILAEMAK